ncbi:MAG: DNA repair protein RecN [Candidatus Humimicrobiia bacterium]
MLKEIKVENIALIDKAHIKFSPGLTILSGETGAGKTLIVEALKLLVGEKADKDLIRSGKKNAYVEGYIELNNWPKLIKNLIKLKCVDEGCEYLILGRKLDRDEKNLCYLNGRSTTLKTLKKIGNLILDLHGQHEHQSLLNVSNHLKLLDNFGKDKLEGLKKSYEKLFLERKKLLKKFFKLESTEKERLINRLEYEKKEIERANIKIGEEEKLKTERDVLRNYENVYSLSKAIHDSLEREETDDEGLIEKISTLSNNADKLSSIDSKIKPYAEELKSVYYSLTDISSKISKYINSITYDPKRLEQVENRLYFISNLKRKYGSTIDEVLKYLNSVNNRLIELKNYEENLRKINKRLKECNTSLSEIASKLSQKREEIAKKLSIAISKELEELELRNCKFEVRFSRITNNEGILVDGENVKPFSNGVDKVEFLISPNPGEPLMPLTKIASGGEISRIMLAIKICLDEADEIPILVFDEIDVGIGGTAAPSVAAKLLKLSLLHQIFCITHLAPVGSMADTHFLIEKKLRKNRTITKVKKIKNDERIEEINRMLIGEKSTKISYKHARELLEKAKLFKKKIKHQ